LLNVLESCVLNILKPQIYGSDDVSNFAYKYNHSILDAVTTLYNNTALSLDNGSKVVKCTFLDYSSAFNTIPRSQTLERLKQFGASGWATKWLTGYFIGRTQYGSSGGQVSCALPNNAGVLQGAD